MKRKITYLLLIIALLILGIYSWWHRAQPKIKPKPQEAISLKQKSFAELPGWDDARVKTSLLAFQKSCKSFVHQDPEEAVGSEHIHLKAKDWQPACHAALAINPITEKRAREFFQEWFTPVEFNDKEPVSGLFTGYYSALLQGSRTKTKEFNVPIYGLPSDLVTINLELFDPTLKNRRLVGRIQDHHCIPYYTREQINQGAISNKAPVLVWVNSRVDRLFLEIEGSGTVKLNDGTSMYLGYAGQNGAVYTSIAKVLIDNGVMTKDNASMQHIKRYLEENSDKMDAVLHKNKSFVFFRPLKKDLAFGTQGVALTPGYSLAVDRKWIPLGAPLWLHTTRPGAKDANQEKRLQRLMIAQDTGGAIRGLVRGDVYWGSGENASFIAGHMKNSGHYWLLLPRHTLSGLKRTLPTH